jgi:hypothetical protein
MMTLLARRVLGAALVAGAGAAASWALSRYLDGQRVKHQRAIDRSMLQSWENEGGSTAPAATPLQGATPG